MPNASFAKKVNTAVVQVHTPGPSFLLFGFSKCGTSTLWAWMAQHPKVKTRPIDGIPPRVHAGESVDLTKEIHSLDNSGHRGQVVYDGWQPETRFSRRLPSSLAADEVSALKHYEGYNEAHYDRSTHNAFWGVIIAFNDIMQ